MNNKQLIYQVIHRFHPTIVYKLLSLFHSTFLKTYLYITISTLFQSVNNKLFEKQSRRSDIYCKERTDLHVSIVSIVKLQSA
ncbi:unnamed protein product [Schistosoma rodhaini]|nr:unnamed protein product [Schistosoma rodhaini]